MDQKEDKKIRTAFVSCFKNDLDLVALKYIMDLCGYDKNDNLVDGEISIWNKSRRNLWWQIRQLLTEEVLIEVEIKRRSKPEPIDESDSEAQKIHPFLQRRKNNLENHPHLNKGNHDE